MAFEHLPSTGAGSAEAGRVVRASWGELVRLALVDVDDRLEDLEAAATAVWRGDWEPDTAYNAGDIVQHNGSSWRASEAIPVQSPDIEPGETSPDPWVVIASGAVGSGIREIIFVIDGHGSAIAAESIGYHRVSFSGTIVRWSLLATDDTGSPAPQTGSIQLDVWRSTFASFPPTNADSITGGNEPALSSDQAAEEETPSGWDTTVTAGDVFAVHVDSNSGHIRCELSLWVQESD